MSSDWIKMRTDLYRDPKVCMIADTLMREDSELASYVSRMCRRDMTVTRNVTRCATVGALVTLWGVTRHTGKRNGDDLVLRGATLSVLDDISDIQGFGEAMASVGWARETDEGVTFPNFFSGFNVSPDESRSKAAERQRRYRERKASNSDAPRNVTRCATRNVTDDVTSHPREEKRREENKKERERRDRVAEKIPDDKLRPLFLDWVGHRAVEDGVHDLAESNLEFIAQEFMRASQEHGNEHVARCVAHAKNKRCGDLCPWWSILEPRSQSANPKPSNEKPLPEYTIK